MSEYVKPFSMAEYLGTPDACLAYLQAIFDAEDATLEEKMDAMSLVFEQSRWARELNEDIG